MYSGVMHIFDFDDTLMWSTEWFSEVILNEEGIVVDPGESIALKNAMDLLKGSYKLKFQKKEQLDGRDVFFMVVDHNGNPAVEEHLIDFYSERDLDAASIQTNTRWTRHPAVTDDNLYYRSLDTVGKIGPRKDMIEKYKKSGDNVYILTARRQLPGMKEKILEVLSEQEIQEPKDVFLRTPLERGEVFKGKKMVELANYDEVEHIYFYDDNLRYLDGVTNALAKHDRDYGTALSEKVSVIYADPKDKPDYHLKIIKDAVSIANRLDKVGLSDEASYVEELLNDAVKDVFNS